MTVDTSLSGGAVHMKQIGSEPNVTCVKRKSKLQTQGFLLLIQHSKQKIHNKKACIQLAAHKIHSKAVNKGQLRTFFNISVVNQSSTTDKESKRSDDLTLQDHILQAETLWALKTACENFSFQASDGLPELFQRMFGDSAVAHSMTMSRMKMSYLIGHGLGPYFLQKTIDDNLKSSDPYYTIHFDKTTTAQVKKQMNVLVRYFSETDGEVKVRFLKALTFGHAKAETVAIELYKTVQDLGLPLKHLLPISCDGPNVNKAIKSKLNAKLQDNFKLKLVDTGSCQLHVVHNAFRRGVQTFGEEVENLSIDLFYFFKLSPSRRENLQRFNKS